VLSAAILSAKPSDEGTVSATISRRCLSAMPTPRATALGPVGKQLGLRPAPGRAPPCGHQAAECDTARPTAFSRGQARSLSRAAHDEW
jgi:hypothetical protein